MRQQPSGRASTKSAPNRILPRCCASVARPVVGLDFALPTGRARGGRRGQRSARKQLAGQHGGKDVAHLDSPSGHTYHRSKRNCSNRRHLQGGVGHRRVRCKATRTRSRAFRWGPCFLGCSSAQDLMVATMGRGGVLTCVQNRLQAVGGHGKRLIA